MFSQSLVHELRAEKRRLEEALIRVNAMLEEAEGSGRATGLGAARGGADADNRLGSPLATSRQSYSGRLTTDGNTLRDAIFEILQTDGPLHRTEIFRRLKLRGIRPGGRDAVNNVGAHLSLDERFASFGRGLWGIAEPSTELEHQPRKSAAAKEPTPIPEQQRSELVPVFAKYKGKRYQAKLNRSRITSTGRGDCIEYEGKWKSPSRSAEDIGGHPVNGWRFWRFWREDGSEGKIEEIRGRTLSTDGSIQSDIYDVGQLGLDDEDDVDQIPPW